MKKIYPSHMDENFGCGASEERLEHLTIDPVFKPFVQQLVDMSKNCLGGAINWIDANLQTVIRDTMRDDEGNEIDEECTDTTYRVNEGRVTVVIYDQNGSKAYFELGAAETIWPDIMLHDAPASPRVLITVSGGIADYVADKGVDVEIFDHDNYEDDPGGTGPVPAHFRDLADPLEIPVAEIHDPEIQVRLVGKPNEWSTWNISQNLTDRWGEINDHNRTNKPLQELESTPGLLDGLRAQMWDEVCFVVRKDGKFGLLFEVEYVSQESEGEDAADYENPLKPHAEMIQIINDAALEKLVSSFPCVEFSIPHEDEICNGRPALWAFVAEGLLNAEQREALGRTMLSL